MPRTVAVILRHAPFGTERASEALRMTVGLTTGDHQITVVFAGEGVLALRALAPAAIGADDVRQHLETCGMLGVRLVADEEALRERCVQPAIVEPLPFGKIAEIIDSAEVVVPF